MKTVHASKFFHAATWLVGVLWVGGGLAVSGCGSDEGTGAGDLTEMGGTGGSGGAGGMAGMNSGGVGGTSNGGGVGGMNANAGGVGGSPDQGGTGGSMNADASVPMANPDAGVADAGTTDDEPEPREDLGEGDGQDVITIGDSYMNLSSLSGTGIQQSLEAVSGRTYRTDYAAPGTLVLEDNFLGPSIPNQYDEAVADDPDIKTVIMTGGGNDVMNDGCTGTDCNSVIDEVTTRLNELRQQMAEDGVKDVIIVGYGYPEDEALHASLDYSREQIPMNCSVDDTPRCFYIDPAEELMGMLGDPIHPNAAGYDLLGEMVWELMQEEGMRR